MTIKTKKDFYNRYIKLPKNLSKRQFKKIKAKFKRLGFEFYGCDYLYEDIKEYPFIVYDDSTICLRACGNNKLFCGLKEISIEDFLKEEEPKKKDTSKITRFELIDHRKGQKGRSIVAYDVDVNFDIQDNGKTIKVFLKE